MRFFLAIFTLCLLSACASTYPVARFSEDHKAYGDKNVVMLTGSAYDGEIRKAFEKAGYRILTQQPTIIQDKKIVDLNWYPLGNIEKNDKNIPQYVYRVIPGTIENSSMVKQAVINDAQPYEVVEVETDDTFLYVVLAPIYNDQTPIKIEAAPFSGTSPQPETPTS